MLREKVIEAAARVYSEFGFRGATTRRIAEAAGVNEVTIFRHFGSKQALIDEVVRAFSSAGASDELPADPRHPERELTEWATAHLARLRDSRSLIRKTMGELEERPEVACRMSEGPEDKARTLKRYMTRLSELGFVPWEPPGPGQRNEEAHAAGAMLMGALFADAMGRDMMPEMYPQPPERAAFMYVRIFLRAIACRDEPSRRSGGPKGANGTSRNGKPASRKQAAGAAAPRSRSTSPRATTKRVPRQAPARPARPSSPKSSRT